MIAAIFGWTKFPQWALELIVIALVAGAIWFWQHERYIAGIAHQIAIDTEARATLQLAADSKTAALQLQATKAEFAYEQEHQASLQYQLAHALDGVRLCVAASAGSSRVPQDGAIEPGATATGPTPIGIPTVHDGDRSDGQGGAGVDIGPMLNAYAGKCEAVSAVLREYQQR